METKELFEKVIADNFVGEEFGELVSVSDCEKEDGGVYVSFQSDKQKISYGEIARIMNELETHFFSYDFIPEECFISHTKEGEKISVRMEKVKLTEYDFSEAQNYLSTKVGGPDTMREYCSNALAKLWEIHSHTNDLFEDKAKMFDSVASTLKLCIELFEKIKVKHGN